MTRTSLPVLALAVLWAALWALPVGAQGGQDPLLPPGVTWDDVNAIARKMYCDVCQGVPLDECESVACRDWRNEIARRLGEGQTADEIMDYFVERYGASVASLPRSTGDRVLVFAIPAALVLVMGAIGLRQMIRLRQQGRQAGQPVRRAGSGPRERPVPDNLDDAELERLQRELEGLDS